MWILDRMEEGKAVLLDEENHCLLVPKEQFCPSCQEGDVVEQNSQNIWMTNPEQTAQERKKSEMLLQLLNKKM